MSRSSLLLLIAATLAGSIVYVVVTVVRGGGPGRAEDRGERSSDRLATRDRRHTLRERAEKLERRVPAQSAPGLSSTPSNADRDRPPPGPRQDPPTRVEPSPFDAEGIETRVHRVVEETLEKPRLEGAERPAQGQEQLLRAARLSKGPFGKYNRKVNTLAEKLAFEEDQKHFYNEVLLDYEFSFAELGENVDRDDPEWRERFREERAKLQAKLDARFLEGLTPEQGAAYRALPEWVRRPDPNAFEGSSSPPQPGD